MKFLPLSSCVIYRLQGRNTLKIDTKSFIRHHSKSLKFSIEKDFSEEEINRLAKEIGFIKRDRKLSAYSFVNTLMFPSCSQAKISLPDMIADLNQQFDVDLSKEALHKKFTAKAVQFLEALIKRRLTQQFTLQKEERLTKHFLGIIIKDSSKFSLPCTYNGDYPGFGNFSKKNGLMNLQYEYDLLSGNWTDIKLTNTKSNDQRESNQSVDSICKGHLYLRDLGYVTPTYLKAVIGKQASYLNRLPSQVNLYSVDKEPLDWEGIHRKFNKTDIMALDVEVLIYKKEQIPCRLVIERVNDSEYNKRVKRAINSAKSRGVGVSKEHKIRCRYNTFITNVDQKILPTEAIRKTYYLRWQVELVFKTWKSFFEINQIKKVKKERLECQLLAKLLWILLNWRLFQACNRHIQKEAPDKGVSILKFFKRCLTFSPTLRMVVLNKIRIANWLAAIFLPLVENVGCEAPKGKITHYQRINSLLNH